MLQLNELSVIRWWLIWVENVDQVTAEADDERNVLGKKAFCHGEQSDIEKDDNCRPVESFGEIVLDVFECDLVVDHRRNSDGHD